MRGVDTIPYKPWHSTSSSHSHSFSPRTHGFRSTTIPAVINNNNTFPQQAALVGVHMGSWPSITIGKSTAFMEWKVARSSAWTFLVTQCPTCPIAALLYALVSDAEGLYLNASLSGSPSLYLTLARPN